MENNKTTDTLKRELPPFTWLANNVLDDPQLTHIGLSVYMALCRFAGYKSRTAFPSISRIAVVARISSRSVSNGLIELQKLGYIKAEAVFTEQGRGSNLYTIYDKAKCPTKPLPVKNRSMHQVHVPPAGGALTPMHQVHCNETYPNERYIKKAFNNKENTLPDAVGQSPGPGKASAPEPATDEQEGKSNKEREEPFIFSEVFKNLFGSDEKGNGKANSMEEIRLQIAEIKDVHERCKVKAHYRERGIDV